MSEQTDFEQWCKDAGIVRYIKSFRKCWDAARKERSQGQPKICEL